MKNNRILAIWRGVENIVLSIPPWGLDFLEIYQVAHNLYKLAIEVIPKFLVKAKLIFSTKRSNHGQLIG